jgi:hypothetical protein
MSEPAASSVRRTVEFSCSAAKLAPDAGGDSAMASSGYCGDAVGETSRRLAEEPDTATLALLSNDSETDAIDAHSSTAPLIATASSGAAAFATLTSTGSAACCADALLGHARTRAPEMVMLPLVSTTLVRLRSCSVAEDAGWATLTAASRRSEAGAPKLHCAM